jgi:hypothetical protein
MKFKGLLTIKNDGFYIFICFFVLILSTFLFLLFPIVVVLFVFLFLTFILKDKFTLPFLCICCGIALTHLTFNSNGAEVGDIVRYYDYYYTGMDSSYPVSFVRFKMYQAYLFILLSSNNFEAQYYGFISFSLFLLFLFLFVFYSLRKLDLNTNSLNKASILYLVIFAFIPFTVYYSFENALAFSVFSIAMLLKFNNNIKLAIFFSFISMAIHNATFPLALLLFFSGSDFQYKNKRLVLISLYFFMFFFMLQFSFLSKFDLGFISRVLDKVNRYLFSFSLSELNFLDIFYNVLSLFTLVTMYLGVESVIQKSDKFNPFLKQYHGFLWMYIAFFSLFFFIPTIGGRYLQLGLIFFIPYAFYYLIQGHRSNKFIYVSTLLLLVISYSNLYFFRSLRLVDFASGELLYLNILDFLSCSGCE